MDPYTFSHVFPQVSPYTPVRWLPTSVQSKEGEEGHTENSISCKAEAVYINDGTPNQGRQPINQSTCIKPIIQPKPATYADPAVRSTADPPGLWANDPRTSPPWTLRLPSEPGKNIKNNNTLQEEELEFYWSWS